MTNAKRCVLYSCWAYSGCPIATRELTAHWAFMWPFSSGSAGRARS